MSLDSRIPARDNFKVCLIGSFPTCDLIFSAGPSFSPILFSKCSSVRRGRVSPSIACSRNTWKEPERRSRLRNASDIPDALVLLLHRRAP